MNSLTDILSTAVFSTEVQGAPVGSLAEDTSNYIITTEEEDEDDIAVAAEAAANAVEEADAAVGAHALHHLMDPGDLHPQTIRTIHEVFLHHPSKTTQDDNTLSNYLEEKIPTSTSPTTGNSVPDPPSQCRICGQSSVTNSSTNRPLLHFTPAQIVPKHSSLVTTFSQDVHLHIFCGKTAGIRLQTNLHSGNAHSNMAQWEIISRAGLKHKFGTGPNVNAAITKTRMAMIPECNSSKNNNPGEDATLFHTPTTNLNGWNHTSIKSNAKKKSSSIASRQFYLVREFEANLAATRFYPLMEPLGRGISEVMENAAEATTIMGKHEVERQLQRDHHLLREQIMVDSASAAMPLADSHPPYYLPPPILMTSPFVATSPTTTSTNATTPTPSSPPPPLDSFPPLFGGPAVAPTEDGFDLPLMDFAAAFIGPIPTLPLMLGTKPDTGPRLRPIKAGKASVSLKYNSPIPNGIRLDRHGNVMDKNGKVTCLCGGRYKAEDGSATAKLSWRSHALTKQHQRWLQSGGGTGMRGPMSSTDFEGALSSAKC